jgi:hypothetical protein
MDVEEEPQTDSSRGKRSAGSPLTPHKNPKNRQNEVRPIIIYDVEQSLLKDPIKLSEYIEVYFDDNQILKTKLDKNNNLLLYPSSLTIALSITEKKRFFHRS